MPAVAGLRTALACAVALGRPSPEPARLRAIAELARAAGRAPTDGAWVAEAEVKGLLADGGIAVPAGGEASDLDGCVELADEIGWPVALKLSAPGLTHKSDAGALALGARERGRARRGVPAPCRGRPSPSGATFMVERMEAGGVELFVAARADAVVPALVVGLGGIWAEAFDDVAIVPLPAEPERVEAALRSLRGAAALTGGRGGEPVDLGALAGLAARAGELLIERGLALLELNPVLARADGAIALDAVARRA